MSLTGKQKRHLRALAHHIKPVVMVGNAGVSEAVVSKVDAELEIHELIKVKVGDSPDSPDLVGEKLAEATSSQVAQRIGKTVVLYRGRKKKPAIKLPKADETD